MVPKQVKEKKDVQEEVIKINKWDGSSVKNAIDDAVKEVVTRRLQYEESFALIDGRLAICSVSIGISGFALLWDYLYPFPESRSILIMCAVLYFILMTILTLYTSLKEKGIFFVGVNKLANNFKHLEASSGLKKFDDKYTLSIVLKDSPSAKSREGSVTKSVASFIDSNGILLPDLVENEVIKLYFAITNKKDK